MGRINYIDVANIREVIGYEEVEIPVTTSNIESGKPIHDGLISFPNIFSHECNSIVVPKVFVVREKNNDAILKKNELVVNFVLDSGANVTKNNDVRFEDAKFYTGVSLSATGTYEELLDLSGNKIWAVSYKRIESEYYIRKLFSESLYFYLSATNVFNPYTQNTKLFFGMFYKLI